MKDGQEAVMQRWLMSAQNPRCCPSATMISRPPSRTTRAFGVRSLKLLTIFQISQPARAFIRLCHHGIVGQISEGIFGVRQGVSNHGEYARTDPSAALNPLAASDADDRRNAGGKGETQALAGVLEGAQVEEKAGRVSRQTYDPGGYWTGQAPLRRRSSSFGARASRGRHQGHYRHRDRRSHRGATRRVLGRDG